VGGYSPRRIDDEDLLVSAPLWPGFLIERVAFERQLCVERYAFEKQETEVRCGKDCIIRKEKIGASSPSIPSFRTVDIKKVKKGAGIHPPTCISGSALQHDAATR